MTTISIVLTWATRMFRVLLVVAFFGLALQTKCLAQTDLSPTAEAAVRQVFDRGLLSYRFAGRVREIAEEYVNRTRYAGRIAINLPPQPDALNIYLFRYDAGMGKRFLRNNCTAFPASEVILCDEALLDSAPSPPPLADTLKADGSRRPSPLLFWIVGHEIGHVVLRHDRAAFLFQASGNGPENDAGGNIVTEAARVDDIRTLNREEVDADRFAMRSLPIDSQKAWLHFGLPLVDALLWETSLRGVGAERLASSPGPKTAQPGDASRDPVKSPPRGALATVRVGVEANQHPPMLLRLYDLMDTIEKTYADFPFRDAMVPKVQFQIEVRKGGLAAISRDADAGLFFGGVYRRNHERVRSAKLEALTNRRAALDGAMTSYLLKFDDPFSKGLAKAACRESDDPSDLWRVQYIAVCDRTAKAPSRPVAQIFTTCKASEADAARCYALISATAIRCADARMSDAAKSMICLAPKAIEEAVRLYVGVSFQVQGEEIETLLPWSSLATYQYQRDVQNSDPEVLDDWVIQQASGIVRATGGGGGRVLELHIAYLTDTPGLDWTRLANAHRAYGDLAQAVGNDRVTIDHQEKVVALLSQHVPAASPMVGYHKLLLARRLRRAGLANFGSNEVLGEDPIIQKAILEGFDVQAAREQAGPVAEAAAHAYFASWNEAVRIKDASALDMRLSYWNAISEAIFSYNMVQDEGRALPLAKSLMVEIEKADPPAAEDPFLAPILENCAVAQLTAKAGDPRVAIDYAQRVIKIAAGNDMSAENATMVLSHALYRSGDRARARSVMRDFITDFERRNHRRVSEDIAMIQGGEAVSVGEILKDEPSAPD